MGTFKTTRLSGNRVLVTGDGAEKCVLNSVGFDRMKLDLAHEDVEKAFEAEVEAFYAPLIEAADRANEAHEKAHKTYDDGLVIEVAPAVEGVDAQPARTISMDHDTAVLYYIETDQSRLIWVGNDSIEILAVAV